MKETIYIESSVISYFTSKPSRDLVIAGRQEIEQGDSDAAYKRLDAISDLPVLPVSDEAEKLASILIKDGPIPDKNPEDALHIAIATVNGIDYLVTWNFTHINNAQMKSKIISIVENKGYRCPIICSPEELLGEE